MSQTFVSFNQVQYLPKDWNNRNKIKTAQGSVWLTVPVLRSGHREKPICEIEINNAVPWRRKHWRSIYLNYSSAPYFDRYAPFLEDVYQSDWRFLAALNEYMLEWLLEVLGIEVRFLKASDLEFKGARSDLVLDMCRQLKADTYVFGAQGRNYAEVEKFEASNIDVVFQDYVPPVYDQAGGDFVSNLSVIDLLFNCGPQALEILMSGQQQIGQVRSSGSNDSAKAVETRPITPEVLGSAHTDVPAASFGPPDDVTR